MIQLIGSDKKDNTYSFFFYDIEKDKYYDMYCLEGFSDLTYDMYTRSPKMTRNEFLDIAGDNWELESWKD
jgi:hypothetical protein